MGIGFFDNKIDDQLSIEDYEIAYDSGYLQFESYINTGLLTKIPLSGLAGSNWYPRNLKVLDMPNVETIASLIFGHWAVGVEKINAPKLKYIQIQNFPMSILSNLNCLQLEDIEKIDSINPYNPFFDTISYMSYSKLSYVGNLVFASCDILKEVYLPNCEYLGDSNFVQCNELISINLPKANNVGDIKYMSKLKTLLLPKISYIGSGYGITQRSFTALPSITSLVFEGVINAYALAFSDLANLSFLYLPNCEFLDECMFYKHLSDNVNARLQVPNVKQIALFHNSEFYDIVISNLTELSNYNIITANRNLSSYTGYLNYSGITPSALNLPNVSLIHTSAFHCNYSYYDLYEFIDRRHNDFIIDIPKCTNIESFCFGSDVRTDIRVTSYYGIILRSPSLNNISSYAFANLAYLKEIDLRNMTIINEFAFCDQGIHVLSNSTERIYTNFKNVQNIRIIKEGAFAGRTFNSSIISFPNCVDFDFLQAGGVNVEGSRIQNINHAYGFTWYYNKSYSSISNYIYAYRIKELHLPKISELYLNADNNFLEYYSSSDASFMTIRYRNKDLFSWLARGVGELYLDSCSNIQITDGSNYSNYFEMYSDNSYYESPCEFNKLYIPECINLCYEPIYNPNSKIMLYTKELYAPKLESLSNIILADCFNLDINLDNFSYLELIYFNGISNKISFNQIFDGNITLQKISSTYSSLTYIETISLPNYKGNLIANGYQLSSTYSEYIIPLKFSMHVGSEVSKIDFSRTNVYGNKSVPANIDIEILTNRIDENMLIKGLNYPILYDSEYLSLYSYRSFNVSFPECSYIKNETSYGLIYFYSYTYNFSALNRTYTTNFINTYNGINYFPNLQYIEHTINIASYSFASSLNNMLNIGYSFIGYSIYAPLLSSLNINMPSELLEHYSIVHSYMGFPYVKKLTLGISDLKDIAILGYASSNSYFVREIGFNKNNINYLSLSNLSGIPGGRTMYSDWYSTLFTLYLPNVETLNLNNISYISQYGLALNISRLDFPNLRYIEDYGMCAPKISILSVPELESLGNEDLYGCSNLTYLELPKCSFIGYNALPSNVSMLKLGYSGVVSMPNIRCAYSTWDHTYHLCYPYDFPRFIQVPESLVSSYKEDSIWGQYLSGFNWNIIAF